MSHSPHTGTPTVHPPVHLDDYHLYGHPTHNSIFPSPPSLPPSAELFSQSETTDFLGFLDNFSWEFDIDAQNAAIEPAHSYQSPHMGTLPGLSSSQRPATIPPSSNGTGSNTSPGAVGTQGDSRLGHSRSTTSSASPSASPPLPQGLSEGALARPKSLLSTPQKRQNHILSEQKRRNAIRDGYLQLTSLLAPAGAPPGTGMPTRGRPKGSGSRGRGSKGKSGILFKAREYIHFLEEGNGALLKEVARLEAAAGIRHS
ncbi:hypothetical protein AcV5_005140 [Taiwanofungus camphoratus]|nr:hypothetical protein AcV5_005140 [Antrodia cinnamomea]KAI0962392.1 hypothetical protein AcV7_001244 [Antrodia cinnamomea]